jgi:hypothetical protein
VLDEESITLKVVIHHSLQLMRLSLKIRMAIVGTGLFIVDDCGVRLSRPRTGSYKDTQ